MISKQSKIALTLAAITVAGTLVAADKPDLMTRELVTIANQEFGMADATSLRIPYPLGLAAGYAFDALAWATRRKFKVSSIRIRKFCADTTVAADRLAATGFKAPYTLEEALRRTIRSEFKQPPSAALEESAT